MNTVLPGIEPWTKILADSRIWHFAFHNIPQLPETLVNGHQREYFDFFINVLAGDPKAITGGMQEALADAYRRPEALKAGFDWYRAMEADAKTNRRRKRITKPILYLRGDADHRKIDEYILGLKTVGAENVTKGILRNCGEFALLEAREEFMTEAKRTKLRWLVLAEAWLKLSESLKESRLADEPFPFGGYGTSPLYGNMRSGHGQEIM